jgi:hypothetical protein
VKKLLLALVTFCALLVGGLSTPQQASAQVQRIAEHSKASNLTIGGIPLNETTANYRSYIKYLTVPPDRHSSPAFQSNDPTTIHPLEDGLRRQIFNAMSSNSERFAFATLADAQENFTMRLAAIDFMLKMGQGPSSGVDFNYHGGTVAAEADRAHWQQAGTFGFRTRPGVSAADAIDGIVHHRFRGECLGAIHVTVLQAARQAIGAERFNQLHGSGMEIPGAADRHWHDGPTSVEDMVPGDRAYIKNKDDYEIAARAGGYWSGENALYLGLYQGQRRFSGMGLYCKTENELRQALKEHYLLDMKKHRPGVEPRIEDRDVRWTKVCRLETGSRARAQTPAPAPVPVASLVGTTWTGSETLPGYGKLELRFEGNGQVIMIDAQARRAGSYTRDGNTVTMRFGASQDCVYTGTLSGSAITGPARYGSTSWTFSVSR